MAKKMKAAKKPTKTVSKAPKKAAKKPAPKKPAMKAAKTAKAKPVKTAAKKSSKPAVKAKAPTPAKMSPAKTTPAKKGLPLRFMPLDNRVLIEPQGKSDRTAGGLFIPDMSDDKPSQGVIIAVGGGARNKKGSIKPLDVKLGDKVIYGQYSGTSIELEGRSVLILREEEILGVVRD